EIWRPIMTKRIVIGTFLWVLSTLLTSVAPAQALLWIGSMGTPYAEAHGVSSDGTAVAGWAGVASPHRAFRWTPLTGMVDLGALTAGRDAEAWGMSSDGQVGRRIQLRRNLRVHLPRVPLAKRRNGSLWNLRGAKELGLRSL
ncbi:MAG: hypothetical protein K6T17_03555, partial [Fimbriimonadales bacterium]|nr:hypothetical protein [Fimbriimonadales bacterium]